MINPINYFKKWLLDLYESIDTNIPDPGKYKRIWEVVTKHFNEEVYKYLGHGDNGIAFVTKNHNVVKFTIDKNEAMLWNKIKGADIKGIAKIKDIVKLSSSVHGDTYIYVINVEYIAHDLSSEQSKLVYAALRKATGTKKSYNSKHEHINDRAVNLVNAFEEVAAIDSSLELIPDLIMDMADKHGGYIYDLKPDNFKINRDGKAVLIDPSVPDIIGDVKTPHTLVFEHSLAFQLECRELVI
jgi:hypothetical protein